MPTSVSAQQVINIALSLVGYHEKATNNQLDDPNANAGSGNYTKYARDLGFENGNAWCQTFVNWCFLLAYGEQNANALLCGMLSVAKALDVKDEFGRKKRLITDPGMALPGDIVWLQHSGEGRNGHAGIVVNSDHSGTITTVEGNSGGAVVKHEKRGTEWMWAGRPPYSGDGILLSLDGSSISYGGSYFNDEDLLKFSLSTVDFIFNGPALWVFHVSSLNFVLQTYHITYEEVQLEVIQDLLKTVDADTVLTGGYTNLLSYPTLVETPFITVKVGDYTFGKYSVTGKHSSDYNSYTHEHVDFPNYITSMSVSKISGQLNQYTINMVYLILPGDDPNRLDRIFSSVGYGKIYISYGDYNAPTFVYKEEEALIIKLDTGVSFDLSRITYTLTAVSTALLLAATPFPFPAHESEKPSKLIREILFDPLYGLQDVFTGMSSKTRIDETFIPTDDTEVEILAKNNIDPLSYILYLVSCMSASVDGYSKGNAQSALKTATYRMVVYDDLFGDEDLGGSYFKIVKINTTTGAIAAQNVFDLDVGYPSDNLVTSFSISSDNSWSLLYNYSEKINQPDYVYTINSQGLLEQQYSPSVLTSSSEMKMTESQKTWWTQMTQFTVDAKVTMKGLVRPAILMTYVRVNALFYGRKHVSSGLYIITGQEDSVDSSGYRTTLSLTRVGGDNDYVEATKTIVTSKIPVSVEVENDITEAPLIRDTDQFARLDNLANSDSYLGLASMGLDVFITDQAGYSANSSCVSTSFSGGSYSSLTKDDTLVAKIAAGLATEEGFGNDSEVLVALKWMASTWLNIYDKHKSEILQKFPDSNPVDLLLAGDKNETHRRQINYPRNIGVIVMHFATAVASAYINCPGVGLSFTFYRDREKNTGKVTPEMVAAVKEVLNGKRYTNATEQGCDFGYLKCGNVIIEGRSEFKSAKKKRPELFIPGVTELGVVWGDNSKGDKSVFVGFPANNNVRFDAFALK